MQLHDLTGRKKRRKVVGRGGKRGTYSGRGVKGQKSRAGHRIRPAFRDYIKQIPKLRGYAFASPSAETVVVNVGSIESRFGAGELVSPKTLVQKGLAEARGGSLPRVKILGGGKLSKAVIVRKCKLSKSAQAAVEKAGGRVLDDKQIANGT